MVSQAATIEDIQDRAKKFVSELRTHNRFIEAKGGTRYVVADLAYDELEAILVAKMMQLRFLGIIRERE